MLIFVSGPSAEKQQWPDITSGEGLWDTPATRPPPSAAVATSNQLAQEKQRQELMRIEVQSWIFCVLFYYFCIVVS